MSTSNYANSSASQLARQSWLLVAVASTVLCIAHLVAAPAAANEIVEKEFLAWARERLHPIHSVGPDARQSDLEPLRHMIGSASMVSLGEGLHGGAEPLEFRNLLFRFLVEQMGFTAIAIESGITEGQVVNQYVLGGPGDLDTVLARGFWPGFDKLPQNAALVRWMREYNADPKHPRKIEFYGLIPPAPGNLKMPAADALRYLDSVDSEAANALRRRIGPMLPMLNYERFLEGAANQYSQLSQPQRDQLTAAIVDMNTLFKLREDAYIAASSDRAYQWGYRSAVVAAQVDEHLRQIPIGWTPKAGPAAVSGTVATNDRHSADNARWIRQQQGPAGKVLLFAHRDHVATAPLSIRIPEGNSFGLAPAPKLAIPPMMGTYLQRWYGGDLVTIGNLLAEDTSNCQRKRAPALPGSFEGQLSGIGTPFFVLDLRTAPTEVASWLRQTRELYKAELPDSLAVGKAFDIVFFSRRVTPAPPCSRP